MFNNNPDFYPTPKKLIDKMLSGIDFTKINTVLEPSAGKGDIVETVVNKFKYARYYNRNESYDIDCIEIDGNLQHILKGRGYRVVHDDFLTYNTFKKYDLIVMNPPFSEGDKHLLKALEMQESGGQIVCLLNSETLNNPYSNIRKDLLQRLEKYNAQIEYIRDAFIDAERKTDVEIALIKVNIPKVKHNSTILEQLKQEEQYKTKTEYNNTYIINADFIKGIVEQYNFEVRAGLKLIEEYNALKPLMLNSFKENNIYKNEILELKLHTNDDSHSLENGYIRQVRVKYWEALFMSDQFMGLFTTNLRKKYIEKINELKDYDFSLYNIYTIRVQLSKEMIQGVEDTIMALFDEFSHKYSWWDETSNNIHYYNGWATNKAWKINKKVIIPLNAYDNWSGKMKYNCGVERKLADIEKVFNYLDGGITDNNIDLTQTLQEAEKQGETKKIKLKYFTVTFYKKGTCHIEFTNEELLHKFNVYGSQRKGWLPPSYGKKKYKDMTAEEKAVIDEFEGEKSYNKVIQNKDYYITETLKLLMLPA